MSTSSAPLRKAMHVASDLDKSWLQNDKRRWYERSRNNPDYVFQPHHDVACVLQRPRCQHDAAARVLWRSRCEPRLGSSTSAETPNLAFRHVVHPLGRADAANARHRPGPLSPV
jgi:hypothetical protein